MISVYDFCNTCAEGTTVRLKFFDAFTHKFVTSIVLRDAQSGCKALAASYAYGEVQRWYVSETAVICKVDILNT